MVYEMMLENPPSITLFPGEEHRVDNCFEECTGVGWY